MRTITVDLFSGMGGFALAAHMMGWETVVLCEIDDNCKVVLAHHFPGAYIHGDIHTLTGDLIREKIKEKYGDESVRIVLCGGFPCQPYSAAGKRLGKEDSRHLWPEMLRVIRECRPDAVVGENVSGIVSWDGGLVFEEVQTDLEAEGYEVQAVVVPACSVGAPHRRDRVWFVANSSSARARNNSGEVGNERRGSSENRGKKLRQAHGEIGASGVDAAGSDGPPLHPRLPESQGRNEVEEGQQHGGWRLAWSQLASFGGAWPFAYAESWGNRGLRNESEEARSRKSDKPFGGVCGIRNVADTESIRAQGDGTKGEQEPTTQLESGLFTGGRDRGVRDHWQNFPTEPPLRVGDDGISARLGRVCLPGTGGQTILDNEGNPIKGLGSGRKLTDSAVNKMGLKMAGNAVVPQVVFQIFRAIEATW